MKKLKNNSGYLLISSIFAAFILTLLLGTVFLRAEVEQKSVAQRSEVQEAFYAAESGIDRTIFELRRNPGWKPGVGTEPAVTDVRINRVAGDDTTTLGFYSLEVEDTNIFQNFETRAVRAIGKSYAIDQNGTRIIGDITRVIFARILIQNPAQFLVSTLGDMRIVSGSTIDADILGKNLFFEINSTIPAPGNQINVNGDVFYLNSVSGETHPDVIYGVGAQVLQSPSVTFAGVDVAHFQNVATTLAPTGQAYVGTGNTSVNLSNLDALGGGISPFQPQVIFVNGDITIQGTYDYSLLVVATGDVFIAADILADANLPVLPQIGILANRDMIIPSNVTTSGGNLTVEAFVMADGDGTAEGVFKSESAPFSLNTLNFTGSIAVRGEGNTAVNMQAFSNRNYNFNPDLANNGTIPFNPFIANLLEWRSAELTDLFPPNTW